MMTRRRHLKEYDTKAEAEWVHDPKSHKARYLKQNKRASTHNAATTRAGYGADNKGLNAVYPEVETEREEVTKNLVI